MTNYVRIKVHTAWVKMPCIHCGGKDMEVELSLPDGPFEEPKVFCVECGKRLRNEDVGL